ncbi:MAG: hypothetical protein AB7P99_03085 [Vicinamibacterales bacterium]
MRLVALVAAICLAGCSSSGGGVFKPAYEYEEELYLALDGTATLNVNASVASLVALRGVDLPVDPRARLDREQVRALFEGPGAEAIVSLSRRDGRRFVHVSVDATSLDALERLAPFAWSTYRFERRGDSFEYRQDVGKAAGGPVGDVGWIGNETVVFRMHVPSRIDFHNAPSRTVERGNILVWEQSLADRLEGEPVEMRVTMQAQSILSSTLLLFGGTIVAAALVFALVIWWVARRGRETA